MCAHNIQIVVSLFYPLAQEIEGLLVAAIVSKTPTG
jgi:hypothetical protein